jgi:putative membrane protein
MILPWGSLIKRSVRNSWWVKKLKKLSGQGTDPDPRFTLANERTFLAWIRTSMALILGSIVVATLLPKAGATKELVAPLAITLSLMGAALAIWAWTRWRKTELALRLGKSLPLSRVLIGLAVLVALLGITMLAIGLDLALG